MNTRRDFITLLGGAAAAWPLAARTQQPGRVSRIGFLFPGTDAIAPIRIAAFREGLRAAGYREPEQIELIIRVTGGDPTRVAPMARELIERNVDILVPLSPAAVQATTLLTSTIPILAFDLETDPIGSGLVKSLARPGGNVTGVFFDGKAIYTPPR
jgi:putative ABC transport system substrate-binding protein